MLLAFEVWKTQLLKDCCHDLCLVMTSILTRLQSLSIYASLHGWQQEKRWGRRLVSNVFTTVHICTSVAQTKSLARSLQGHLLSVINQAAMFCISSQEGRSPNSWSELAWQNKFAQEIQKMGCHHKSKSGTISLPQSRLNLHRLHVGFL